MTNARFVVLALPVVLHASTLAPAGCSRGCSRTSSAQSRLLDDDATTTSVTIETVEVPGDEPVLVVIGNASVHRPIVYLHGMCADPAHDLAAWGGVSEKEGTILALAGDVPCTNARASAPTKKWSDDVHAIDLRIARAVEAVNDAKSQNLERSEILVVGSSMGAARAERLARSHPRRYTGLVLVGSPRTPSPANLRGVHAVANLAGEREAQSNMRSGTKLLAQAGTATRFWELPDAQHGEYGPDGERVMSEAIDFVSSRMKSDGPRLRNPRHE